MVPCRPVSVCLGDVTKKRFRLHGAISLEQSCLCVSVHVWCMGLVRQQQQQQHRAVYLRVTWRHSLFTSTDRISRPFYSPRTSTSSSHDGFLTFYRFLYGCLHGCYCTITITIVSHHHFYSLYNSSMFDLVPCPLIKLTSNPIDS